MGGMRILSLLPAATDMVYLLGLEKSLVGDEKLVSSPISSAMSSLEIDIAVRKLGHKGTGVFHIDQQKLKQLKPDLILTQELCSVCAVGFTAVRKAARILDGEVRIVSLEPESVEDILDNILLVGQVTGYRLQAQKAVKKLKKRTENCKLKTANLPRPKVLVIEWLDPMMVAGHWVPEMVERAGGKMLVTKPGEKSRRIDLAKIKIDPDIVIIAPCGFDIERTIKEKHLIQKIASRFKKSKVYLMDGDAYLTRPGPRIIKGIELLSDMIMKI